MGSFNTTGCISHLPIISGDEVVVFLMKLNTNHLDVGFSIYPTSKAYPIFLPFKSTYDDCGKPSLDSTDTSIISELETIFNTDIETLIDIFSNNDCRDYGKMITDIDIMDNIKKTFNVQNVEDFLNSITLSFEHYSYYEQLSSKIKSDEVSFIEETGIIRDILFKNMFGFVTINNSYTIPNSNFFLIEESDCYYYIYHNDTKIKQIKYLTYNSLMLSWNSVVEDEFKIYPKTDIITNKIRTLNDYNDIMTTNTLDKISLLIIKRKVNSYINSISNIFVYGHNFAKECVLYNRNLEEETVKFLTACSNIMVLNLFFSTSNYCSQTIKHNFQLELEQVRTEILKKQYEKYTL